MEAGGNFIDTANVYTNGTSETLLGEFLKANRDGAVLATKYTNAMPGTDPNAGATSGKNMIARRSKPARRLQTDYIDLYLAAHLGQDHAAGRRVMRAFVPASCGQGKILHAGVSDMAAWAMRQGEHAGPN